MYVQLEEDNETLKAMVTDLQNEVYTNVYSVSTTIVLELLISAFYSLFAAEGNQTKAEGGTYTCTCMCIYIHVCWS